MEAELLREAAVVNATPTSSASARANDAKAIRRASVVPRIVSVSAQPPSSAKKLHNRREYASSASTASFTFLPHSLQPANAAWDTPNCQKLLSLGYWRHRRHPTIRSLLSTAKRCQLSWSTLS